MMIGSLLLFFMMCLFLAIFAISYLGNTDAETDSEAEGERSSSLFSAIEADSISILQTGNFLVVNLQC